MERKPPRLISVAEAQVRLGLSAPTLYKYMAAGQLPYVRFGRSRRIAEDALDEFIRKGTVGAPPQHAN